MRLLKGLFLELRPMPLIAALIAVSLAFSHSGAPLGGDAQLYLLGIFFLLYSVHFLDTYEDYHVRKEDQFKKFDFAHGSGGLLKKEELLAFAAVCSLAFFAVIALLSPKAGPAFLLLNLAAFAIGASYSHFLSRSPLLSILAAPSGIALAMAGAYLLATGGLDEGILAFSAPFFMLFLGAMSWMDMSDYETDQRSGKPSLAIVLGIGKAKTLGLLFLLSGLGISIILSFSAFRLVLCAAIALAFLRAYAIKPADGIPYVMGGILAFLILEAAL